MPIFRKCGEIYYKFPSPDEALREHYPWLRRITQDPKGDDNSLCSVCRQLEFEFLFRRRVLGKDLIVDGKPEDLRGIVLGPLSRVLQADCGFCHRLGVHIQYNNPACQAQSKDAEIDLCFTKTLDFWDWKSPSDTGNTDGLPISAQLVSQPAGLFLSPSIFRLGESIKENLPMYSAREVPGVIDLHTISKWISDCEGMGYESSSRLPVYKSNKNVPVFVRYVDVVKQCVVEGQTNQEYVALSYVLGNRGRNFNLANENETKSRTENGLAATDGSIPQTIRDAIYLCKSLNVRYL